MKTKLAYPLALVGGAFGWQTVKAILVPAIILSGAAAGGTAYVRWVIKSQTAHMLASKTAPGDELGGEVKDKRFVDDLKEMVAAREDFIRTYNPDDRTDPDLSATMESMLLEDAKILFAADQLRRRSEEAYTDEIASETDHLRSLDKQLRAFGVRASSHS